MEEFVTPLDYVSGSSILPKGSFGISPSSMNDFVTAPHKWYRDNVLGEKSFTGSTASVLGTIVHYCAEQIVKTGKVDKLEIYDYIFKECVLNKNIEEYLTIRNSGEDLDIVEEALIEYLSEKGNNDSIDAVIILDQWKHMGNAVITYLQSEPKPLQTEQMINVEVLPGYYAAGSADSLVGSEKSACLVDYKTTSEKSPKKYIPLNYKYQLLTYAYIYNKMGIKVDRIRIVWVTRNETGRISETNGKPLKDYPSKVEVVTEMITRVDLEFIESLLKLIAETVEAGKQHPELLHVIWKDYRLKQ